MFITAAQKEQIRTWLEGLRERTEWMLELSKRQDAWEEELTWRLAAERALHTSVEYTTDIGSLVIDALVMRDPGGYADILKVLVEEDVLPEQWFDAIYGVFDLRARFIREHANVQPVEVRAAIETYAPLFAPFADHITRFVQL